MNNPQITAENLLFLLESPFLTREQKLEFIKSYMGSLNSPKPNYSSLQDLRTYIEKNNSKDHSEELSEIKINSIYIVFVNNDIIIAEETVRQSTYYYYQLKDFFTRTNITKETTDSGCWKINRKISSWYGNVAYCVPLIELLPLDKFSPYDQISKKYIKEIQQTIYKYLKEHPLFIEEAFERKRYHINH